MAGAEVRYGQMEPAKEATYNSIGMIIIVVVILLLSRGLPSSHGQMEPAKEATYNGIRMIIIVVIEPAKEATYNGITVLHSASVSWSPMFAVTLSQLRDRLPGPAGAVRLSQRSSLVLDGADISVVDLQLDGAIHGSRLMVLDMAQTWVFSSPRYSQVLPALPTIPAR
eukprot:8008705-Pyramimonas_sp.AAC.1